MVRSGTAPRGPYGIFKSVKTFWNEPTMSFGICKRTTCPSIVIVLFFESSFQSICTGLLATRGSSSNISFAFLMQSSPPHLTCYYRDATPNATQTVTRAECWCCLESHKTTRERTHKHSIMEILFPKLISESLQYSICRGNLFGPHTCKHVLQTGAPISLRCS